MGKRYDAAFKRAALELAKYKPISQVYRELGIGHATLYKWRSEAKEDEAASKVVEAQAVPDIAATLFEMIEQHINDELEFWANFQAVCKGKPPQAGGGTASEGQGKGVRQ